MSRHDDGDIVTADSPPLAPRIRALMPPGQSCTWSHPSFRTALPNPQKVPTSHTKRHEPKGRQQQECRRNARMAGQGRVRERVRVRRGPAHETHE